MQQSNFKGIVYLTKAEYESLIENGSITKSEQTLTYDRATLYVTTDTSIEEYYVGNTQWDTTPTQNSVKVVTSGGVYTALSNKQDSLPTGGKDRYLHTNSVTGNLEWAELTGVTGSTSYEIKVGQKVPYGLYINTDLDTSQVKAILETLKYDQTIASTSSYGSKLIEVTNNSTVIMDIQSLHLTVTGGAGYCIIVRDLTTDPITYKILYVSDYSVTNQTILQTLDSQFTYTTAGWQVTGSFDSENDNTVSSYPLINEGYGGSILNDAYVSYITLAKYPTPIINTTYSAPDVRIQNMFTHNTHLWTAVNMMIGSMITSVLNTPV